MLNLIKQIQFKILFSFPIFLGNEQNKGTTSIEKSAAAGSGQFTRGYEINGFTVVQ